MKKKYKIGDWVEITHTGHTYSSYAKVFKELGFKNLVQNYLKNGDICEIFGITEHENQRDTMLALRNQDGECLIGQEGVKLINKPIPIYEIY